MVLGTSSSLWRDEVNGTWIIYDSSWLISWWTCFKLTNQISAVGKSDTTVSKAQRSTKYSWELKVCPDYYLVTCPCLTLEGCSSLSNSFSRAKAAHNKCYRPKWKFLFCTNPFNIQNECTRRIFFISYRDFFIFHADDQSLRYNLLFIRVER